MRIFLSFIFIYLFFLPLQSTAQDKYTDSLKSVLTTSKEDTNKVNTLIALSEDAFGYDPNEAIRYGLAAESLAKKLGFIKGSSVANKDIGIGHYIQADYMVAIEYWQRSLKFFEDLEDLEGVANLQSNIGAAYSTMGDEAKAIEFHLKSLKTSEEIDNANRIATALLNIGVNYSFKVPTYEKAMEYYWKALPYSIKSNNNFTIGTLLSNLGEIHYRLENYDSALYYFEKSLTPTENSPGYSYSLNYMGRVYAEKGEFSKAIELQEEAIESAEKYNAKNELSIALIGLGRTYAKQGNSGLAIEKFNEAKEIARAIPAMDQIKESYEGLSIAYAQMSDFRNAFEYQLLLSGLKDTIYSELTDDKIKGLQFSYQLDKKESEIQLKESEIEKANILKNFLIAGGLFLIIIIAGVTYQYWFTRKSNKIISRERNRSEALLLNILPKETAEELKEFGKTKARKYDSVSILFTDFKGFTSLAASLTPEELVQEIDFCYKKFDQIVAEHGIEKIKTIGDAYMAAGGLPRVNTTHPNDAVAAAIEIRDFMIEMKEKHKKENKPFFEIRIGIHSGPVVAGVVGTSKFAYDMWGDTVNIAARMESNSEVGKINISQSTYDLVKENYEMEYRGEIEAKNRGMLKMYFVEPVQEKVSVEVESAAGKNR